MRHIGVKLMAITGYQGVGALFKCNKPLKTPSVLLAFLRFVKLVASFPVIQASNFMKAKSH